MRFKTTKQHSKYWRERKIDWQKAYTDTWSHPHRNMISTILGKLRWSSLFEVGCGSGPNLINITKRLKNKQLGGTDLNSDAITLARKTFKGAVLDVGTAEDIMMSDNSTDIVLSDMVMIYLGPRHIHRAIKEMTRVCRHYLVLCELHSDSFYSRMKLRFTSGYYAYNYKKLLEKHGFYNITFIKIPTKVWDGKPQKPFGYIIIAKKPKRT